MTTREDYDYSNEDTMKIGPRVPTEVWEDFKDFVRNRHGKVRGKIGEELAEAVVERMHGTESERVADELEEIRRRVERNSMKLDDLRYEENGGEDA